jgi:hypothetical protein
MVNGLHGATKNQAGLFQALELFPGTRRAAAMSGGSALNA